MLSRSSICILITLLVWITGCDESLLDVDGTPEADKASEVDASLRHGFIVFTARQMGNEEIYVHAYLLRQPQKCTT